MRSTGEALVRTTAYSLPSHLHDHVEFLQPTTLFSMFQPMKAGAQLSTNHRPPSSSSGSSFISVHSASGGKVDASCAETVTISCLKQLYNAVGYTPSANIGNHIAVTGYLGLNANEQDLNLFYKDQVPEAVNSSFTTISVNGEGIFF